MFDKLAWARNYKRDFNKLLKANHLCRDCKKQDGYTLNGYTLCFECNERALAQQRKRRERTREQRRENAKALYQERKANGLCPCCGHKFDNKSYQICGHCRALKRKSKDKAEVVRRVVENVNYPRGGNGLCWRCNREPVKEGKHLCEGCYAVQLTLLEKALAANKGRRIYAEHQQG